MKKLHISIRQYLALKIYIFWKFQHLKNNVIIVKVAKVLLYVHFKIGLSYKYKHISIYIYESKNISTTPSIWAFTNVYQNQHKMLITSSSQPINMKYWTLKHNKLESCVWRRALEKPHTLCITLHKTHETCALVYVSIPCF